MRTHTLMMALATGMLLAACTGSSPPLPDVAVPSAASPSGSSPAPAPGPADPAPTGPASPTPAGGEGGGLVLGGSNLGVTMLGTAFPKAVAAVTSVLGAPTEDPAAGVACLQSSREVQWEGFRLAEGDGGVAAGWRASSTTLQTPSGVTIGTDLATLERVYGAAVTISPPSTDSPNRTFQVEGADVLGELDEAGQVRALYSSFCGGP